MTVLVRCQRWCRGTAAEGSGLERWEEVLVGAHGHVRCKAIGVGIGAIALLACSEPEPAASSSSSDSPIGVVASPVVGGEMVDACQWPSAIHVNSCTATLIHPRVVTTAAHCLGGSTARVLFGNRSSDPGAFTLTGTCRAGARGSAGGGTRNDWGYCVIPEDDRVKKIPVTPPLVGCEAEQFLKAGATAWVVGYGATNAAGQGQGVKRQVAVKVNRVTNGIVDVGDREHGACHGDSGGPLYVQVSDATHNWGWRVAGSTSSAGSAFCDCTCNTIYVDIAMHVDGIVANEDIDVTPCTDENGDWDPSEACQGFASAPHMGTGTYPDCQLELTKDRIETCGTNPFPAGSAGSGGAGGSAGSSGTGGSAGTSGMGGASGASGMNAAGASGAVGGMSGSSSMAGFGGAAAAGAGGTSAGVAGSAGVGVMPPAAGVPGVPPTAVPPGAAGGGGAFAQGGFPIGAGGAAAMPATTSQSESDSGCRVASPGSRRASGFAAYLLACWAFCSVTWRRRRTTSASARGARPLAATEAIRPLLRRH